MARRQPPEPLSHVPPPTHTAKPDRITIIGLRETPFRDLYFRALRLSWPRFLAAGATLFLLLNTLFGALYYVQPSGIEGMPRGSFADCFFFSVQTLATIGYGHWAPISFYANTIATFETLAGASLLALFAGLSFARFARPTAQIRFSRSMVVTTFDGGRMLMVRLANERGNQIIEANASLSLVRDERTAEGHYIRRVHDLKPVRGRSPVFRLSFLVMHRLDENSPLHGCTAETLQRDNAEIVAIVTGLDDTTAQMVHARSTYGATDIRFGHRFADLFGFTAEGVRAMDYRRFHETEAE